MEITHASLQTVAPQGNVIFDNTVIKGSGCISHREGSGLIKVKGATCGGNCRARFKASFGGNIAVPTGQTAGVISVALTLDGEAIAETVMTVTPAAVEEFFNVGSEIYIDVPSGTSDTIGVTNISTIPIKVTAANLIVERVA